MFASAAAEPELWPISVEGKWGYIDVHGTVKIEPQYAAADHFSEDLARVSVFGTTEADLVFDRTYDGFIDHTGSFVIPAQFPPFYKDRNDDDSYAYSSFEDGVAVVSDASSSSGLRGLIDRTGELIAPMKYSYLGSTFNQGLCRFEIDHEDGQSERGYMDYRGDVVIRPKNFLYGSGFFEGRASITIRDEAGDRVAVIDRKGKFIVAPGTYTAISDFDGGLCRVVLNGEVGLMDRDGDIVVQFGEYEQISEPEPGTRFIGQKHERYYVIGSDGKASKLPSIDAEPVRFHGDLILIRRKERSGYVKPDGTIVVEPKFDDLSGFEGELAKFRRGDEHGYVNRSGDIVWATKNWPLPLRYSIRDPLKSYLPDFAVKAMPLSYNWDCENAIVFVCDGSLETLRKWYLKKRSETVKVRDHTDYDSEPGKLSMMISFDGVAFLEVYAMCGDQESTSVEQTDNFVRFYSCKSMDELRRQYPKKTVGIILEN